jgi:2-polyprenyl-3-methyl-5-hydroxy-6-metoxy-1,4-benzoquinol methylase
MSVERLHFAPGRMAYHGMTAAEHVCRYVFAAQAARGRRVLDIACGEGYGSAMLAEAGAASVLGVDVAQAAIDAAAARFVHPALAFRAGDAESLPAMLGQEPLFDLVVSFETIEHVAEVGPFLEGLRRVLAPEGMLMISAPNEITADGTSANPFHRRAYTLDSFLAETEAVLGPARQVLLGCPVQGFGIIAGGPTLAGNDATELATMLRGTAAGPSWVLPAQREQRVDARGASFFVAVWGGDAAMSIAASPVSHAAFIEQYEALQWLRVENARLLREQDATRDPAPPRDAEERRVAMALADLRRAALLERQRLEQALADIETERAAARALRAGQNTLMQRSATLRAALAKAQEQAAAARRNLTALQPFIAALRDQRDAARRDLAAQRALVAALRREGQAQAGPTGLPAPQDDRPPQPGTAATAPAAHAEGPGPRPWRDLPSRLARRLRGLLSGGPGQ